ncbi:ABC transporter permease [Mycoplasmopsis opalescens]|uniref:ABC transporter permease n=1 Tax=Mycoplasmopsis opalescens TaxID=114886 RepID=UPI0004A77F60|nr:ABC transporter permease [Mycoplasmopsis opalescens]
MNSSEFNRKYQLSEKNIVRIHLAKERQLSSSLGGKPKVLAVEIIKRFFKNPAVLISTIILISLIIAALIFRYTSIHEPGKEIYNGTYSSVKSIPSVDRDYNIINDDRLLRNIELIKKNPSYAALWDSVKIDQVGLNKWGHYRDILFANRIYELTQQEGRKLANELVQAWGLNLDAEGFENLQALLITPDLVADFIQKTPRIYTLLGTNQLGKDIWTTIWAGTLESLMLAFSVATIEMIIGVAVGAYLGFHTGKWIDSVMMRVIEIFQAPPSIIWILMFVSIGGSNLWVLFAALIFTGWTGPIGVTRLYIITVKDEEYITASRSIGAKTSRQIFIHALPAIMGKIAMFYVRRIPSIILSVASLAFLGFFKGEGSNNLGQFIQENSGSAGTNPWILALPILILVTISLTMQFIAIGLHDALDPKVIKLKK